MTNSTPSNTPMLPAGSTPMIQTWINAVTKPREETYAAMAASPDASPSKAYLWVFLAGLVSAFISALVRGVTLALNQQGDQSSAALVGLVCAVPILAGLSVLGLIISAGLTQWVAGLFKGTGTFSQLVYVFGAIAAPITLISSAVTVLSAVPFLALCLLPVSILLFVYTLVLEAFAVKGINRFGWGEAIGSILIIPGILILCSCLVLGSLMLMGPGIGNVFSSINQSLTP